MSLKRVLAVTAICTILAPSALAAEQPLFFGDISYPVKQNTLILDSNDSGGNIELQFGTTLAEKLFWNAASALFSLTDDLYIQGKLGVGESAPDSIIHLNENTAATGSGAGLTIENQGTGDSLLQFLLTGVQRWVVGIDNNDVDKFKIASSIDLASDTHFTIDTTGNVGIGTAGPTSTLDVVGGSAFLPGPSTVPVDGNFDNSQWSLWLDETNDEFELKAKKSNGAVISQTVGVTSSSGNIVVQNKGVTLSGTPHTILNFTGANAIITDAGAGVAEIDIFDSDGVFGTEYAYAYSGSETINSTTTPQQKVRLSVTSIPAGTYRIGWSYEYSFGVTNADFISRVQIDDITTIHEFRFEPGETYGNNQYWHEAGFYYTTLSSGNHNIDLDYYNDANTSYIRRASLEIWRVE